jgi:hypothetical protein
MRWAGHVARVGEKRNVYRLLVGKPEGKRPLGRPRLWWVNNIKMDLVQTRCGGVGWIGPAQDRHRWRALVVVITIVVVVVVVVVVVAMVVVVVVLVVVVMVVGV